MTADNQWPRYVVFQQTGPGKPYQYVGSVHAPDAEMALLNARDVFVRRPAANALWVVPAARIFSKTLEELTTDPDWADALPDSPSPDQSYHVFWKSNQAGTLTLAGSVDAPTPEHAMKKALQTFKVESALWWWVIPNSALTRTEEADVDSMFAPAADKIPYRDQGNFHTLTLLKKIKAERGQETSRDEF